jgi:hypothetical protein
MSGRARECSNLPESSGSNLGYSLTPAGQMALAAAREGEQPYQARRWALERKARAAGHRFGTICGRWQRVRRVPDLRLSGLWLGAAGFDLGQTFEIAVGPGELRIRAV